jgi:hypothetical protein
MIVDTAKYEDGWLMLKTPATDALKWLIKFVQGKNYDIVPHTEKRSRTANAYAWVLISKLSEALNYPKEEIYRRAVHEIGGKSTVITVRTNAVRDFARAYVNGHLGRSVSVIDSDAEKTDLLINYGSSDFSTKQMAQLIDNLVQDCLSIGIETKDENEIRSLLEEWNEKT